MNKITLISFIMMLSLVSLVAVKTTVLAEQTGSSPESGATSRIKTAYDWLVAKGTNYGATDASDWSNNWGSMWNRIMESAAWEPDGTATEADVASTKTFYAGNGDRTIKVGTAPAAFDYITQSKVTWDDNKNGGSPDGDNAGEESVWLNTAGSATTGVWQDTRTGLYWSNSRGSFTNSFTVASCDYFTSTPRGSYTGGDSDCGTAINTCGSLSLDANGDSTPETDWYLPTQKELQLAYINGMYNQTNTTFVSTSYFWSSAEFSDASGYAWYVVLSNGYTNVNSKDDDISVRCVRRD